jgi:hypothetical protein
LASTRGLNWRPEPTHAPVRLRSPQACRLVERVFVFAPAACTVVTERCAGTYTRSGGLS